MTLFILFLAVLFVGVLLTLAVWFMVRWNRHSVSQRDVLTEMVMRFQKEMGDLRQTMNQQLMDLSQSMNDQHSKNTRFLMESHREYAEKVEKVQHRLGELQNATVSMLEIGREISSLHDILRSPKLRGGLGELLLEELLRQMLPADHYALQYHFKDGTAVDAAIFLGEGIIPVDAKFPLENFKRILQQKDEEEGRQGHKQFMKDVKGHIDSIASKYILPQEGTFDFALMYVPAENVYYEMIIKEDTPGESLSEYARRKKVIPVSPNSFYAYLQAIVRGLKGLKIERSALTILESLGQLETDLKKAFIEFEKIGGHLANAQSAYERASKGLEKLQFRLAAIEQKQEGNEKDLFAPPLPLEKENLG